MGGMVLRLFVAIYPPPDVAAEMLRAARRVGADQDAPAWRETPLEQVHLTLQFIGDRREDELGDTLESVRRAASGIRAFTLTPRRVITLPERPPTRLLAIETDSPPPLLELQRRLAVRLARRPRKHAGDRFTPHLTVRRFGSESRLVVADPVDISGFEVRELVLAASVLKPEGAEHRAVERIALTDEP